jgi:hypothetical protein
MKKKIKKKLKLNKTTISSLNNQDQLRVKGGATMQATCETQACGTCVLTVTCNTCITCEYCPTLAACVPTLKDNTCLIYCPI